MSEIQLAGSSNRDEADEKGEFFNDNSFVINVLPSLLQDLYHYDSDLNVLVEYIDTQIRSQHIAADVEKLQQLKQQIQYLTRNDPKDDKRVLAIDENKSIMMHLFLGRMFTKSLEILSNKNNIKIFVVSRDEQTDVAAIGKEYWTSFEKSGAAGHSGIFVRVSYDTLYSEDVKSGGGRKVTELMQRLQFLELKRLLENAGLTYDTHGNLIRVSHSHRVSDLPTEIEFIRQQLHTLISVSVEPHFVDMSNWYCSCPEYQMCYAGAFYDASHHRDSSPAPGSSPSTSTCAILTPDRLTAKYFKDVQPSLIHQLLQNCRSNLLDPIPICPHIISVLIIAYNMGLTDSYCVQRAASFSSIVSSH